MTRRTPRLTPRKEPRQDRSKATVDAILDATAIVLVKDGYEAATTNRVADVAGVSIGSLYQYFPTLESMVTALLRRHRGELGDLLAGRLAELADEPLADVAHAVAEAWVRFHMVDAPVHRIVLTEAPRFRAARKLTDLDAEVRAVVAAFVESRGDVRDAPAELAAFVLVRTLDAVTRAFLLEREDEDAGPLVRELAALVHGYLRA